MSEVLILVDSVDGKVSKSTGELATFAKAIGKVNAVVFDAAKRVQSFYQGHKLKISAIVVPLRFRHSR